MQNLPKDILYKIRDFAMPRHPCTQEIKNRIRTDYIHRPSPWSSDGLTFASEEHFWRDFEIELNYTWSEWEVDLSLDFSYDAHKRYMDTWYD